MHKAKKILSIIILVLYFFTTLYFWSEIWGGIGFFGALITFPFSMIIAWFFTFLHGWWWWNLIALLAFIIFIGEYNEDN